MRTSLIISLVLLAVTVAVGFVSAHEASALSQRYISAAEELRILTEKAEWSRAEEVASAYLTSWHEVLSRLQILINHDDIDDVTLSLVKLQAAIRAQDQAACFEACAELKENASHIYHRDAFTLGNVL